MTGNTEIRAEGINHLALVCKNMATTVHFYRDVLGFPLVKTLELPGDVQYGGMQHFFFDLGNQTLLAFIWFPSAPEGVPGLSRPPAGGGISATGSMHHLAINVAPECLEEYRQRLLDNGIEVSPIVNHDNSRETVSPDLNETTYVRSIYFTDPDGMRLEMAAWVRELTPDEADMVADDRDSEPLELSAI